MHLPGLSESIGNHHAEKPKARSLSDLNYDVLYHILSFVLSADAVKEPADEIYRTTETIRPGPKYHFHTAIMRTNKAMHRITKNIFASKHVIRFSTSDTLLFDDMFRCRMFRPRDVLPPPSYWTRNIENATDVRMEITLTRPNYGTTSKENRSGLILLEHLQHWVESVMSYELLFRCGGDFTLGTRLQEQPYTLSHRLQQRLLGPLRQLRSVGQVCSIPGSPRHSSALYWARASTFSLYNCMLAYSKRGDAAFRACDYVSAKTTYTTILRFKDNVLREGHQDEVMRDEKDDPVLMQNLQQLIDAITINNVRMALNLGQKCDAYDYVNGFRSIRTSSENKDARAYGLLKFYKATIMIDSVDNGPWSMLDVIEDMEKAVKSYPALREGLDVIEDWASELPNELLEDPTVEELETREELMDLVIERLVAIVPNCPFIATFCDEPGRSSTIDHERYLLRTLGYQGDLYEERVLQAEDYSVFDQARADGEVQIAKQKVESQITAEKAPILWLRSLLARKAWKKPVDYSKWDATPSEDFDEDDFDEADNE